MPRPRGCWSLVAWGALAAIAARAQGAPPPPPFVVPNTEVRVLPRMRADRLYQLNIALPESFRQNRAQRYPVVFVTDGYWDFTTVAAIYGNLRYSHYLPEMLVVGLAYAGDHLDYDSLRTDDLDPLRDERNANAGHAGRFLDVIEHSAMPLLARDYRADLSHCYLMGDSQGGGFVLYAMLTRPQLFQGYVADSPSTANLGGFEQVMADSGRSVSARLYVSTCQNEWPSFRRDIIAFCDRLASRAYLREGLHFRVIPNLRHADGKPETYTQGLRYVCEPIAPERGPMPDFADAGGQAPMEIAFFPAHPGTWSEADQVALSRHDAYLAKLLDQKSVRRAFTSASGDASRLSTATTYAGRRAAQALGRADPAVAAGVLAFTIIEGEDTPSHPLGDGGEPVRR